MDQYGLALRGKGCRCMSFFNLETHTLMELKRLDPSLRRNLKDLLEGYMEHCQVSSHLMARIDFPIYYHGFKFGAPVFTHAVPEGLQTDSSVIGLVGLNTPSSRIPSEVLLQLIEILVQQPEIVRSSILRLLPVANPVALELEEHAPSIEEWPVLEHMVHRFHQQAADGLLEVIVAPGGYSLTGSATTALFRAIGRTVSEGKSEFSRPVQLPDIRLSPLEEDGRWHLKLAIPENWSDSAQIHDVARFISQILRFSSNAGKSSALSNSSMSPSL